MMTLEEIKEVNFRKAGMGGYKPDDVDSFIDEVIETVERLQNSKTDLLHKMDILANKIEEYRKDEETVRNALIASQRISDSTLREANEKSEVIIKNAEAKAAQIIKDAENTASDIKSDCSRLTKEATDVKSSLYNVFNNILTFADKLPSVESAEKLLEKLDKIFPETVTESIPDVESSEDDVKVAKEQIKKEAPVAKPAVEVVIDEPEAQPRVESVNEKFKNLKFGDNYDVNE